MAPFLSNEQMEGLVEMQRALQLQFRYEDCIEFARVINLPENQAKLAVGEGIFEGFDPTTDPAYFSNFQDNIHGLARGHQQEYEDSPFIEDYAMPHVARLKQIVVPAKTPNAEQTVEEKATSGVDNQLFTDNKLLIELNEAGMCRVDGMKTSSRATEPRPSSSKYTSKQTVGGFNSLKKSEYMSNSQSTISSRSSSTSALPQTSTSQNEDNSASGALSTRTSHVPSYSSINNAKKKKDDGKDFMRTKVKYFDDWSRRMNGLPLPPRPKRADGRYAMSRYKQKSAAVKALTPADGKSLIAFIASKEKALRAVEQTGSADPAMYDDNGMLVVQHDASSSKPSNQPLDSKKEGSEELGEEDEDASSENEDSDAASSRMKHYTSSRKRRRT